MSPKIHKWTGKRTTSWFFDVRDGTGKKRRITRRSKAEAQKELARWMLDQGTDDPHKTFGYWASRWLDTCAGRESVKPQSLRHYEANVRLHILPELGSIKMGRMRADMLEDFLRRKLASGLAPKSIRHLNTTLYGICRLAVKKQALGANYADGLATEILGKQRRVESRAIPRAECKAILAMARERDELLAPLLSLMYRAGLRVSEAIALQWDDIDYTTRPTPSAAGTIHVRRAKVERGYDTPKSGRGRPVDLDIALAPELRELRGGQRERHFAQGLPEMKWVFTKEQGTPFTRSQVSVRFQAILQAAGIADHRTPHCLRHSFAKQHLEKGASVVWVQQQLGHAFISTTVDTYGKGAVVKDPDAAGRLDDSDKVKLKELGKLK